MPFRMILSDLAKYSMTPSTRGLSAKAELLILCLISTLSRRHANLKCLRTSNLVCGWRTTTLVGHRRHDLQGQRSRSKAHIVYTYHLCLFLIQETKYCVCVIRGGRGHTVSVSAKPGGHIFLFDMDSV